MCEKQWRVMHTQKKNTRICLVCRHWHLAEVHPNIFCISCIYLTLHAAQEANLGGHGTVYIIDVLHCDNEAYRKLKIWRDNYQTYIYFLAACSPQERKISQLNPTSCICNTVYWVGYTIEYKCIVFILNNQCKRQITALVTRLRQKWRASKWQFSDRQKLEQ